jgi:uncharacterized membrane protein YphA (DoxX/SURF4 family)
MPVMWDSYYWCLQVDGGLLLCVGYLALVRGLSADSHADSLAAWWATTARQQLAIFYLAAGVWKVNTSFLDARTSCAPIFVLTLLQTLGYTPPPLRASQLALLAPGVTILGELTIGILLLLPSRAAVRIGVLSALLLHLGIALTPPPNNATPFSPSSSHRRHTSTRSTPGRSPRRSLRRNSRCSPMLATRHTCLMR